MLGWADIQAEVLEPPLDVGIPASDRDEVHGPAPASISAQRDSDVSASAIVRVRHVVGQVESESVVSQQLVPGRRRGEARENVVNRVLRS